VRLGERPVQPERVWRQDGSEYEQDEDGQDPQPDDGRQDAADDPPREAQNETGDGKGDDHQ
jgi:hypothetical protein